jgi:hypothetical protein
MNKPRRIDRPFSGGKILFGTIMTLAWIGCWIWIQGPDSSPRQRWIFPFMPLFALAVFQLTFFIAKRRHPEREAFDEMQRRIWLESTHFSYQVSFAVLSTTCPLQAAHPEISSNPFYRLSWLVLPLTQHLGAWIAYRRYR